MPRPLRADFFARRPATAEPVSRVVLRPRRDARLRVTRRRLGMLLAAYAAAMQLAAEIESVAVQWPMHPYFEWGTPASIAVAMLRGVPLGYFLAFGMRRRGALAASLWAGGALGVLLELCSVAGDRPVEPLAIVATALSAGVGAISFLMLARRLRASATNDAVLLAPDLPLVGGAYVAAPLLWLRSASGAELDALGPRWGLVLLALYGASLIGSARASRGPAGGGLAAHALAAAAWATVGLAPLAPAAPGPVALLVLVAAVFAALHPLLLGARGRDRRVEVPALRRALPMLALYFALAALAPLAAARAGQPGAWPTWAVIAASIPAGGWLDLAATMTVVGYALTELLGRREDTGLTSWRTVGPLVTVLGAAAAALRVWAAPHGTAVGLGTRFVVGLLLCTGAARAGAWIYQMQRRHARAHKLEGPGVRSAVSLHRRRIERAEIA
jgi:hypothetical protein